MNLDQINEVLIRLGYLAIDAPRLTALRATLPTYTEWLADCARRGKESPHWLNLRAAQFSVSQPCAEALARAGLQVPAAHVALVVVAEPAVRAALMRLYKAPASAPPFADITAVRKAFANCASNAPVQPGKPRAGPSSPSARPPWPIHKVHGARFAVAVEHTTGRDGRAVLQIEAAERLPNSRTWDWPAKIVVQLRDHEIVEFWSVLQGRASRAQFTHHGTARDKSVELVAQPKTRSFMLAVRQGDVARAVPVPASHAFSLATLALQVLVANSPGLTASDVIALIAGQPFPSAAP